MHDPARRNLVAALTCATLLLVAFVSIVTAADVEDLPIDDELKEFQRYFAFVRDSDERTLFERALEHVGLGNHTNGRSFALIAGVSEYPAMPGPYRRLIPAAEDIRKLTSYLITQELFDEIVVLADENMNQRNLDYFLEDYFPRRLQELSKRRSRFLFAYSGHEITNLAGRGFLLTSKATGYDDPSGIARISMKKLRAMFGQIIDTKHQILVLINACYSGDFVKSCVRPGAKRPACEAYARGCARDYSWWRRRANLARR